MMSVTHSLEQKKEEERDKKKHFHDLIDLTRLIFAMSFILYFCYPCFSPCASTWLEDVWNLAPKQQPQNLI